MQIGLGIGIPFKRNVILSAFNPSSLFKNNEPGVWYDPSDIERYASQLGPELVTNGDFSNGTTGWTLGTGWTISGGKANANVINYSIIKQTRSFSIGKLYRVSFTISDYVSGAISAQIGNLVIAAYSSNGTYTAHVVYPGDNSVHGNIIGFFGSGGSGNFVGSIDNISVRELTAIDTATMFQDAAGTTPVTAVEQPVGLILDKSKGLVLGPELVTNGTFDTDISGWAISVGTPSPSWSSGRMLLSGNGQIAQAISVVSGKRYQISVDITVTSGTGGFGIGTVSNNAGVFFSGYSGTSRTVTASFLATTSTVYAIAATNAISQTYFDNISVRELPGNHATQTTATSRPVLSARYNLLTKTEQFDDAAWTKGGSTITANTTATNDPLGTNTADILVENTDASAAHFVSQNLSATSGVSYTYSVYAKAAGRNWLRISAQVLAFTGPNHAWFDLQNGVVGTVESGTTASIASLGNGWFRCSWTRTAASTNTSQMFICAQTANNELVYTGDGTSGIYIWGASLVPANQSSLPYQRVNTATDYDADPSKFKPYLRFDGVDDWLVTPTITPGTDKAQVFAGVRKLSDAATNIMVEFSNSATGNNGALAIGSRVVASDDFWFYSRGTIGTGVAPTGYASPITNILTGLGDISGDSAILRVNGNQAAISTADQGTGNFLAYPLYIGRRGGTTIPFNGHLYGLIVRFGANLPIDTIEKTEKFIANKTGFTAPVINGLPTIEVTL